jgi:hypothetical protein
MAKRVAFLIGNQTFRPNSGLSSLRGPENDLKALARLFGDPARGRFEVNEFFDKAHYEVLSDIELALGGAARNDLFLIYYSGHGKLDRSGHLCLATADTREGALLTTSIRTRHLSDLVEHSNCNQVVLFLDCCYSGAVEVRGDVESELHVAEKASGFFILTASSELQAAREEEPTTGGAVMGRFTAALVNGIESGAADSRHRGEILLSDLKGHLEEVVTGQTPKFFARNTRGDPLISLSPGTTIQLLANKATPSKILDQDTKVRQLLAENNSTPPETLVALAQDQDETVRRRVAWNKATPSEILTVLSQDQDAEVRRRVAWNEATPSEILTVLSQDQDAEVRRNVARNKATPSKVLADFAKDQDTKVRQLLAESSSTPPETLVALAQDRDAAVRRRVAWNKATPSETLTSLIEDEDGNVRLQVAMNSSTTSEARATLKEDQIAEVRCAAISMPRRSNFTELRRRRRLLDKRL